MGPRKDQLASFDTDAVSMTCEQHQELITKVRGLVRAGRDGKVQELRTIGPNPQRLASLILGWSIQNVPKRVAHRPNPANWVDFYGSTLFTDWTKQTPHPAWSMLGRRGSMGEADFREQS
jgi:hypothetical protein